MIDCAVRKQLDKITPICLWHLGLDHRCVKNSRKLINFVMLCRGYSQNRTGMPVELLRAVDIIRGMDPNDVANNLEMWCETGVLLKEVVYRQLLVAGIRADGSSMNAHAGVDTLCPYLEQQVLEQKIFGIVSSRIQLLCHETTTLLETINSLEEELQDAFFMKRGVDRKALLAFPQHLAQEISKHIAPRENNCFQWWVDITVEERVAINMRVAQMRSTLYDFSTA